LAVSAGGGVKMFLTKWLFIAPEGRVGYQPVSASHSQCWLCVLGKEGKMNCRPNPHIQAIVHFRFVISLTPRL
jgi:hypothetical protein